jgi:hypothetical protein
MSRDHTGADERFRSLHAEHVDPILGFAMRRADQADDAADIVAETSPWPGDASTRCRARVGSRQRRPGDRAHDNDRDQERNEEEQFARTGVVDGVRDRRRGGARAKHAPDAPVEMRLEIVDGERARPHRRGRRPRRRGAHSGTRHPGTRSHPST